MPIDKETAPLEIKTSLFSQEQREELEKRGYSIYTLTGQSIRSLRGKGHRFDSSRDCQGRGFETNKSRRSEVAVNPKHLFLEESNNKTLTGQLAMIESFGKNLSSEIEGVTAILGEAPDYAELAFAHHTATGQNLFSKSSVTRTLTLMDTYAHSMIAVGDSSSSKDLFLGYFMPENCKDHIFAAPLIVPTAAVKR